MRKWMMAAAALFLAVPLFAEAADPALVKVKGKDSQKYSVYTEDGRLYGTPALLQKGERWTVTEEKGHFYAEVAVEGTGKKEKVRLTTEDVEGHPLIDVAYFAPQAGLQYDYDEKKGTISFKKGKVKKDKADKEQPVLIMWDPDSAFVKDKPFFSEKAGRRILSPSWIVADREGMGEHKFPMDYLRDARAAGVEVAPLMNNNFDPKETTLFLRNKESTNRTAARMAAYAAVYGFAGYNMDFENMDPKDKDWYSDFVSHLARVLHKNGKTLSVDVTAIVDGSPFWSGCYDRKTLAGEADWMVFMGYDQTPGASTTAGPVSSYNWLDQHIGKLLGEIPKDKLILGLPFYTRIWSGEDGSVTSDVLTQKYQAEFVRKHKLLPTWREKERQFYSLWREGGLKKSVWLEEERSLAEKLSLVKKYDLAGAAFWRYEFEDGAIYAALEQAL